jgi:hypothetical protein
MTTKLTKDIITSSNKGGLRAKKGDTVTILPKSSEYISAGLLLVDCNGDRFYVRLDAVEVDEKELKDYLVE